MLRHSESCSTDTNSRMHHSEFQIGLEFYYGRWRWRVTDVGTRTVVAIKLDGFTTSRHELVTTTDDKGNPVTRVEEVATVALTRWEAQQGGYFNGPIYGVVEHLFVEEEQRTCISVVEHLFGRGP